MYRLYCLTIDGSLVFLLIFLDPNRFLIKALPKLLPLPFLLILHQLIFTLCKINMRYHQKNNLT